MDRSRRISADVTPYADHSTGDQPRTASALEFRPHSSLSVQSDGVGDSLGNVRVYARFRPLSTWKQPDTQENSSPPSPIQVLSEHKCTIAGAGVTHEFSFDRVFAPHESQEQVFECCFRDTISDVLLGYNCAVLAYGQTGAGKSYTMVGPSVRGVERGAIPRIVESLFDELAQQRELVDSVVSFSCMEIYNERVKDLLHPERDGLHVREHQLPQRGFYVRDLSAETVHTSEHVYSLMERAAQHRAVAQTQMNPVSSRSHSIVQLRVAQTNKATNEMRAGTLFFVDLAGSEKVSKTGAVGQVLTEAKSINKSLSALGMVIQALTDSRQGTHVPYRDSKLTRILQESLGGNARTSLVVNCSLSPDNTAETLSTLRFGTRAKRIRNKPVVNTEFAASAQLLAHQLAALQVQHEAACAELRKWRAGVPVGESGWYSPDNNVSMDSLDTEFEPLPECGSKIGHEIDPETEQVVKSEGEGNADDDDDEFFRDALVQSLSILESANTTLTQRNTELALQIEIDQNQLKARKARIQDLLEELQRRYQAVEMAELHLSTVCSRIAPKLAFVGAAAADYALVAPKRAF